jgi:serine/threonine-protein kinase
MVKWKMRLTYPVAIAWALLFSLAVLWQPLPLTSLDLFLFDGSMNLPYGGKETPSPVVLIEIDEKSTRMIGSWPWPRHLLAEMVTILAQDGAKVIGLDIPLAEKESNQGLKELRSFKEKFHAYSFSRKDDGLRPWVLENLKGIEESLDSDRILVERTKQAGNVVFPAFITKGRSGTVTEENDRVLLKGLVFNEKSFQEYDNRPAIDRISGPFSDLSQSALALGHAGLSLRKGMEGRSHALFISYKGGLLPSFPLQAVMAFLGLNPKQVSVEESRADIQDFSIPLWQGEMLVDYRRAANPVPRHSFGDVLQEKKVPSSVNGKIVLIGFNLEETPKIPTPITSAIPLVELHSKVIQTLLAKKSITRPSFMIGLELAAVWIVGLFAAFFFPRAGRWSRLTGTVGLIVLVLGIGLILFSQGVWARTGSIALFVAALYPALCLSTFFTGEKSSRGSFEVNRLLGIRLQGQGLLDQALEQFRELPLDQEAGNLLYHLGLEYESRGMNDKALIAYTAAQKGAKFRDLDKRIPRLKKLLDAPAALAPAGAEEDVQAAPEEPVKKIGRYEVIQELGRGSMGLVYKALDPKLNRLLAIKTIRFSDEFDPDVVEEVRSRFFREAEIAGRLSHPSIVTVYDVGEDQDLTYMAMEYLEGDDLEKFIRKDNLLPLRSVLEVVASVADALDFAHKSGVIHRDIKPANIMLLKQGGVKVTDFGIAKAVSSSRTRTGVILGTPNYMSPEQIMGQRIDYRTDIFSLGVLFYQTMTGELPFHGDNLSTLLYEITQVKHPPVRELGKKVPRACEQIVDKALAKHPDQRFSSASEIGRLARLIISKMDQLKQQQSSAG